jgi:hypothetical protein
MRYSLSSKQVPSCLLPLMAHLLGLGLVVGYDGVKGLEVKGVLSYFMPGQAFSQADGSVFASVKAEWKW